MSNRSLSVVCFLTVFLAAASAVAAAQESRTGPPEIKKYKAVKGFIEAGPVRYPVFVGITEAEECKFGGVTFTVAQKNHKQALLMAEKIKRFYLGKKIGSVVLPQFKKITKPDTIAWNSLKCGKGNDGAHAVVRVDDKTVAVYLMPSCDEGVLAHIL